MIRDIYCLIMEKALRDRRLIWGCEIYDTRKWRYICRHDIRGRVHLFRIRRRDIGTPAEREPSFYRYLLTRIQEGIYTKEEGILW